MYILSFHREKVKKWLLFCVHESSDKTCTLLIFCHILNENTPIICSNIFSLTADPIESSSWYFLNEQQDLHQDLCSDGTNTEYPCFCPDGYFCCEYDLCDVKCCPYNTICASDGSSQHYNLCMNGKHILTVANYYIRKLYYFCLYIF